MTREQAREAAQVMLAWADGKEVECKLKNGSVWTTPSTNQELGFDWSVFTYRIKPTATLRPWTADEVPLGAWIRSKQGPTRGFGHGIIIYADDGGVPMPCGIQNSWVGFHDLLNNYEHSTDGGKTWLPCGVMEETK